MAVKNLALVAAAGLLAYAAWRMNQDGEDVTLDFELDAGEGGDWLGSADGILTDATQTTAEVIDSLTGGILRVSNMAKVTPIDLQNRNVQAMLRVIRRGEGTSDADGYRRIFGGQLFSGYADHPRITVSKSGYTSSAAGAYQFIVSSWDETKRVMGLKDFSPASQDLAAVGRIAARGALDDVKAGRFEAAIRKIAREWASLPGSPYGQPTISMDTAKNVFALAGGNDTAYA